MTEEARPPGMLEVFKNDLPRIAEWLRDRLNDSVNWLFSTTAVSGGRRRWLLTFVLAYLWARAAFNAHPIQFSDSLLSDLIVYPFPALFSASIMRHMLVLVLVFLLGLRVAAAYLDDVFELNDVNLAERYILQAVFASQYDRITISGGKVDPDHQDSPVYRIGGPGRVNVNLDSAALFEKSDGQPNVIGPQDKSPARQLDRFERLRGIVDLRERWETLAVSARTKDGIVVTAQGGKMLSSVARSRRVGPSLKNPMTFDPESIEKIVYGESVFKHFTSNSDKTPPPSDPPGGAVDLKMKSFIEGQLRSFISSRFFSEFFTQTQEPEREQKKQEEEKLRMAAEELGTVPNPVEPEKSRPQGAPPPASGSLTQQLIATQPSQGSGDGKGGVPTGQSLTFIGRDEITRQFYDEVNRKALERGLQLHWIDIGTWVLPDEARSIARKHLDAWGLSVKNQSRGNTAALEKILRESRAQELVRLFRSIPLDAYFEHRDLSSSDPGELVWHLLKAYADRIHAVWSYYDQRGEPIPEEIDLVTRYLNRHLVHRVPRGAADNPEG